MPTLIYADRRMVSVSAVTTTDPAFRQWELDRRLPYYLYSAGESPISDGSHTSISALRTVCSPAGAGEPGNPVALGEIE